MRAAGVVERGERGQVHRQHLEESSRCASLQRQLSQEKTLCLRKEQQLYHACAEVEILKVRARSGAVPSLTGLSVKVTCGVGGAGGDRSDARAAAGGGARPRRSAEAGGRHAGRAGQ
eukprot:2010826-Rhodomonas_salina.2